MQDVDILKIVLDKLNTAGIRYMLTGSVALMYYAEPRMTRDADIIIEMTKYDIDKIYNLFKDDFYIDKESIEKAVENQSMFNIIYIKIPTKFDFIMRKDTLYRKLEFERRKKIELSGIKTYIVSIEDLILSKLYWAKDSHSEIQIKDAKSLLEVENIDFAYIKEKAEELGIIKLLEEMS